MINFRFRMPTEIVFGRGEYKNVGEYLKRYGKKVLLVHSGSNRMKDIVKEVKASAISAGLDCAEVQGVRSNPYLSTVYEGMRICRQENVEVILAIGGGSAIDTAKAIGLGVCFDGDIWDLFTGKALPQKMLPVGSVLTIAGAGSECSRSAVITDERDMIKRYVNNEVVRPVFTIMDPELTYTVPWYETNCCCIDIMAHTIERYFTNVKNVELTDNMCEALLGVMLDNIPKVNENPYNYDVRAEIMWAATLSHNGLMETGRIGDFATHNIAHQLGSLYDIAHGATIALIMPVWMKYVYKHDILRFARYANKVWGVDMDLSEPECTALVGIELTRKFFISLGMPTSLKEVGVKEADIPELVERCIKVSPRIGNFVVLGRDDIRMIYEMAY